MTEREAEARSEAGRDDGQGSVSDADAAVAQIVAELREDGVHVGPAMSPYVDAAELAAIEEAVGRIEQPVYVVAIGLDRDDVFGGSAQDLLARVHDEMGTDGWFTAVSHVFADGGYGLVAQEWSASGGGLGGSYDTLGIAEYLHPDDLGAGLVEMTTAMADGTVVEKGEEARAAFDERHGTGADGSGSRDGSDGDGGLPTAGVVLGAVLALAVLAALVARARRRTGGSAAGPGRLRDSVSPAAHKRYTLPASVLERVREADDARLRSRADREVLALGERIDATLLDPEGDAAAWQAALDHYDGARRVLARSDTDGTGGTGKDGADEKARGERSERSDLLDVVGAIVLAERGEEALTAAERGKPFRPAPHCFLNPLHGRATARRKLDHAGRRLDVPVCQRCRLDLGSGARPDILDVARRGDPVHYFDAGVEPWSSTGYGALDPDLVRRLHSRA